MTEHDCDVCGSEARVHKYDKRLCHSCFYDEWRKEHGY